MHNEQTKYCRVCGLEQEEPQYGEDGRSPTFEICSCCGVEFGYEDATRVGVIAFRKNWIDNGLEWFDLQKKPIDWLWEDQKKNIPEHFK